MTLLQNQRKGDGVAGVLPTHLVLQVLHIEGPGAVGLERDEKPDSDCFWRSSKAASSMSSPSGSFQSRRVACHVPTTGTPDDCSVGVSAPFCPDAAVQPTRHMRATARTQADKRATSLLVYMGISSMTAASMIGESPGKGKSQLAEGRLGFEHETRL